MPALAQLYPYKAGPIEPVVMPGEFVGVWVNKVWNFYKVDYIEPVPASDPIEQDFGTLAAGASTAGAVQLNLLEMADLEFGQFRVRVIDDVNCILFQGRADQRHKTNVRVGTYTRFTNLVDPCGHTTEFYVHEDNWAYIQATNPTDYALTQARVAFYGFRYVLQAMPEYTMKPDPTTGKPNLPQQWTRIPATAHL
jgi:hypothetical protein